MDNIFFTFQKGFKSIVKAMELFVGDHHHHRTKSEVSVKDSFSKCDQSVRKLIVSNELLLTDFPSFNMKESRNFN